jgi:hypothetical protein
MLKTFQDLAASISSPGTQRGRAASGDRND